jgi:outer membrane usher protein FimD/PapC
MAGGYIVMGFNKFNVGIDGGAANMMGDMNLYNQVMGYNDLYNVFDYSYYLSGLVGYGNLFIGIGQNVYSDYTNNDMLYSIGFLSHIKKISLKLGVMHSNSLGPQFNVGIGLHIK